MAAQLVEGLTHDWGGPSEEAVCWFWGRPRQYLPNEPEPEGVQTKVFPYAGISIIINGKHRALIRGGKHQLFRPPQCDFGHVELWVDGDQVVFDPGTWSYKPKPGEPDLSETQHHNMAHIEGEQQMTRLGRFLWGDWPKVEVDTSDDFAITVGNQRRNVRPSVDDWVIDDETEAGNVSLTSAALMNLSLEPRMPTDHIVCSSYREKLDTRPRPTWPIDNGG